MLVKRPQTFNYLAFFALLLLSFGLLTGARAQADATDIRSCENLEVTSFEAINVAYPDGGVVLSDEPLMAGRSEISGVSQALGSKRFVSVVTFYPNAYPDSTFVAPGEGLDTPDGGFFVIHDGFGTGKLNGARIFLSAKVVEGVDDLPCEAVGPVVKLEGVILHQAIP